MTAVIALDYLTELLLIADSRVSYPTDRKYDGEHGLQKVYPIFSSDKRIVAALGFCGDVTTAKAVFHYLLVQKNLANYPRNFIIAELKDNLLRWIQEAAQMLPNDTVDRTDFMFCALEPKIERPFFNERHERTPSPFANPFRERHICVYSLSRDRKVMLLDNQRSVTVIGSGSEQKEQVIAVAERNIGVGRGEEGGEFHRVLVVLREIAAIYKNTSISVGDVFQVIRIAPYPDVSGSYWYWWPGKTQTRPKIRVHVDEDDVISLTNHTLNLRYVAYPIWHQENWKPSLNLISHDTLS